MSSTKSSKNHRENPRQRFTRKKRARLALLLSLNKELVAVRAAATELGGKSFISSLLGRVKQLSSADTVNIIDRATSCNQLIADMSALPISSASTPPAFLAHSLAPTSPGSSSATRALTAGSGEVSASTPASAASVFVHFYVSSLSSTRLFLIGLALRPVARSLAPNVLRSGRRLLLRRNFLLLFPRSKSPESLWGHLSTAYLSIGPFLLLSPSKTWGTQRRKRLLPPPFRLTLKVNLAVLFPGDPE
jgi:hypothetical protein